MYDIAVIGAGPAGYSAAINARKREKSVIVIGQNTGWLSRAECIENYPGMPGVSGQEMLEIMAQQAKEMGAELRGGVVHRVQSGSVPIGIISNLDAQIKHYTVREGDTVVMISDGIEQNDPDGVWLTSYLSTCGNATPEEIVYQICVHAADCEGHDDCSAIALRITSAEE